MPDSILPETFRPVPDFPGYIASDRGRIQSCWKRGRYPALTPEWHDLKLQVHSAGYRYVRLFRNRIESRRYVHEIILTTFCGPSPDGMLCRHLNGDPADNRWPENIAWGTHVENSADMFRHGRGMAGETHYASKLTEREVVRIRRLVKLGFQQKEVAKWYAVNPMTVGDIVRRKNWKSVP